MVLGDMKVRRIHTGSRSHIEPEYDPTWSPLTRLRWHAAVAEVDCDHAIRIRVHPGTSYANGIPRDEFCVTVNGPDHASGYSSSPFDWAWTLILGLATGAAAARRPEREERTPIFDRLATRYRLAGALS